MPGGAALGWGALGASLVANTAPGAGGEHRDEASPRGKVTRSPGTPRGWGEAEGMGRMGKGQGVVLYLGREKLSPPRIFPWKEPPAAPGGSQRALGVPNSLPQPHRARSTPLTTSAPHTVPHGWLGWVPRGHEATPKGGWVWGLGPVGAAGAHLAAKQLEGTAPSGSRAGSPGPVWPGTSPVGRVGPGSEVRWGPGRAAPPGSPSHRCSCHLPALQP